MKKLDITIQVDESKGSVNHFVLDGNVDYATITRYEYCKEKLVVLRVDRQEAQNLADTLNEWIRVCKKIEEIK